MLTKTGDYNSKLQFVSRTGEHWRNYFWKLSAMKSAVPFFNTPGTETKMLRVSASSTRSWATTHRQRGQRRFITISLGSVISSIAYLKPSRPKPESLMPP